VIKLSSTFKRAFITEIYQSAFDQNNTAAGVLGIIFEVDAPRIYEMVFSKRINKLCYYRTYNLYCTGEERILKPIQYFGDIWCIDDRTRIVVFTMAIPSEHKLKFK
jgi:hypothetical protein